MHEYLRIVTALLPLVAYWTSAEAVHTRDGMMYRHDAKILASSTPKPKGGREGGLDETG